MYPKTSKLRSMSLGVCPSIYRRRRSLPRPRHRVRCLHTSFSFCERSRSCPFRSWRQCFVKSLPPCLVVPSEDMNPMFRLVHSVSPRAVHIFPTTFCADPFSPVVQEMLPRTRSTSDKDVNRKQGRLQHVLRLFWL